MEQEEELVVINGVPEATDRSEGECPKYSSCMKGNNEKKESVRVIVDREDDIQATQDSRFDNYGPLFRVQRSSVVPQGSSFFVFQPHNKFRLLMVKLVNNPYFSHTVLFIVLLNALSMAATDPTISTSEREAGGWQAALYYFDLACLGIYVIEAFAKMVAMGAFMGPSAYIADSWNRLDFLVIILSWSGWIGSRVGFQGPTRGFNALRVFRAIKPLRVIKSLPGICAILDSLSQSVPLLASTTLLFLFFFFTFAVVALEFYQNSLGRRCTINDEELISPAFCNSEKSFGNKCENTDHVCNVSLQAPFAGQASFDNVFASMLVIFQVVTLDSWSFYLYSLGNAEHWLWTLFFFTALIVLISFVVVNLFLAVIHTTFMRVRKEQQHSAFVNAGDTIQGKPQDLNIDQILGLTVDDPCVIVCLRNIQPNVSAFIKSRAFELGINFCIVLNTLVHTYETSGHGSVADNESTIMWTEVVFCAIFSIEIILRFIRFGTVKSFFVKDAWNTFDLVIVVVSIVGLCANYDSFSFLRAFRLLRLLRRFEGLQRLLSAAVAGILPTFNVLLFTVFVLFVFACMGMSLFGGLYDYHQLPNSPVPNNHNNKAWLRVIDRLNFNQFDTAFILLFQIMTGDNWSLFMWYSFNIDVPVPWLQATVYFVAYYFVAGLIILSLFTVVILENFELSEEEKGKAAKRLRLNIEKALRTGKETRKDLGLSGMTFLERQAATTEPASGETALGAIRMRMASVHRGRSLATRLGSLSHYQAPVDETFPIFDVTDLIDNSFYSVEHTQNGIIRTFTLYVEYWKKMAGQTYLYLFASMRAEMKIALQGAVLETFERVLATALDVGRKTLRTIVLADWQNNFGGMVDCLDENGYEFPQVTNLRTYRLLELCLAEHYTRQAIVRARVTPHQKLLGFVIGYLERKRRCYGTALLREEYFQREKLMDAQHSEWHELVMPDVRMPPLSLYFRDPGWVDASPEGRKRSSRAGLPQAFYQDFEIFKQLYKRDFGVGSDITAVASSYDIELPEGPLCMKVALTLILEGQLLLATHVVAELKAEETLESAYQIVKKHAINQLSLTESGVHDVYLRQAFKLHTEKASRARDAAKQAVLGMRNSIVDIPERPPLLLPPLSEASDNLLIHGRYRRPSTAPGSPIVVTEKMACSGYCSFCSMKIPPMGVPYNITATRLERENNYCNVVLTHSSIATLDITRVKSRLKMRQSRILKSIRVGKQTGSPTTSPPDVLNFSCKGGALCVPSPSEEMLPISGTESPLAWLPSELEMSKHSSVAVAVPHYITDDKEEVDIPHLCGNDPPELLTCSETADSKGKEEAPGEDIFGNPSPDFPTVRTMEDPPAPGLVTSPTTSNRSGRSFIQKPLINRRQSLHVSRGENLNDVIFAMSKHSSNPIDVSSGTLKGEEPSLLSPLTGPSGKTVSPQDPTFLSAGNEGCGSKRSTRVGFTVPEGDPFSKRGEQDILERSDIRDRRSFASSNGSEIALDELLRLQSKSFGYFGLHHPVRIWSTSITQSTLFQLFILVVVVISSITVVFIPRREAWELRPAQPTWMLYTESAFITVFAVEATLKIISKTWYSAGEESYIRGHWNKIDFLILWCQVIGLFLPDVKPLRLVRAVRPLRLINKIEGLQVVLGALLASLSTFLNVFVAGSFFLFLCALMGRNLFHDRFDRCTMTLPGWTHKSACVGTTIKNIDGDKYLVPVAWIKPEATFDTIHAAMATCLEIASLSSWSTHAYNSMDITEINKQPQINNSKWTFIYYVIVISICTFFLVNLFIGVIITNINTHRGIEIMDERQQNWALLSRTVSLVRLPPRSKRPDNRIRGTSFDIANSKAFNILISIIIVVNVVIMATRHASEPGAWESTATGMNYGFVGIYLLEVIIKVLAYSKNYFSDPWNRFDFLITMGSCISIALYLSGGGINLTALSVARIFRIGRIFRLARKFKGVATMFHTLMVSLPQILNISLMLLILNFIYTVIGMNYFSHIKFQFHLNRDANFRSFSSSLSIVYRMVTLDDWNKVMRDCAIQPPFCTINDNFDNCGSRWAFAYFFSFFIIGSYVFLNLVIAVILDNFTHTFNQSIQFFNETDINAFLDTWMKYDPECNGVIPRYNFPQFTTDLYASQCAIATSSCFHPVRFCMRFKALMYELDIMQFEASKIKKRFKLLRRRGTSNVLNNTNNNNGGKINQLGDVFYKFEHVLMVMSRTYHGFPGLSFDELNERAGKEVFWEVAISLGIICRSLKAVVEVRKAQKYIAERYSPQAAHTIERCRLKLNQIQRGIMAIQQEKMQLIYSEYSSTRYANECMTQAEENAAWRGELDRVPRDGSWTAMTLAIIYAPPCRVEDYEEARKKGLHGFEFSQQNSFLLDTHRNSFQSD